MKLWSTVATLLMIALLLPSLAFGATSPPTAKIVLDGKTLTTEVDPLNVDGNVLVPIRQIFEKLGAKVTWDQSKQTATIVRDSMKIQLTVGDRNPVVNGSRAEQLEVAPMNVKGNVLVPVRFVGQKIGYDFKWVQATSTVQIFPKSGQGSGAGTPPTTPTPTPTPTPNPGQVSDKVLVKTIELTKDQLLVGTDKKSPQANVFKLTSPDRIVIDLPGTELDASLAGKLVNNVGEAPSLHPMVEKVRFSNFDNDPATVRITLDMKAKADLTISAAAGQANLLVGVLKAPEPGKTKYKVVIDAGHGGTDSGAVSLTNKKEKDFVLAVANKVAKLLEKEPNIQTYMTRSTDTFVTLKGRSEFANNLDADLFLSIHGNKATPTAGGTETFYYERADSKAFANVVQKHLLEATGFKDRGVKEGDLHVVRETKMPAALAEVGFLSNAQEEALMYTSAFQDKVAASFVAAIKEYLKIS
ncbi:N-acetylmuramoyl-L-alanine amidase [Paenibacillus chitinolyticus]|uniref:N-acetylmuramoyl-L-alanine amidase n=1 Tax=Paenibacillus chitinolyticus TaxID=79263 RepID=UPI00366FFB83